VRRVTAGVLFALACLPVVAATQAPATRPRPTASAPFRIEEATIAQVQAAIGARRLTCRALVQQYLARIEAYDKRGPAINASS